MKLKCELKTDVFDEELQKLQDEIKEKFRKCCSQCVKLDAYIQTLSFAAYCLKDAYRCKEISPRAIRFAIETFAARKSHFYRFSGCDGCPIQTDAVNLKELCVETFHNHAKFLISKIKLKEKEDEQ